LIEIKERNRTLCILRSIKAFCPDAGNLAGALRALLPPGFRVLIEKRRMAGGERQTNSTAAALAAAGIGEWEADLVSGEVVFSPQISQLFGFPEDKRLNVDEIRARYIPEDQVRVARETTAAFEDPKKGFVRNRFRIVRADGSVGWLEARGKIYRDSSGRAIRTLGVMLDITDQKETEEALEQSWRRFEEALSNTSVVVFQQDLLLRYTWVHNPKLGYKASSVLGKTDAELMPAEFAKPLEGIKRKVIQTGLSSRQEVVTLGAEGQRRYDLYVEPKRDQRGAVEGITCAAIELSATGQEEPVQTIRMLHDRDLLLDRVGPGVGRGLFTVCASALQRKLRGFRAMSTEDLSPFFGLRTERRFVRARQDLPAQQALGKNRAWLIGSGWVYSSKLLLSGERQIIGFYLPGDMIKPDDHLGDAFTAASDCVSCEINQRDLMLLARTETQIADALEWAASRQAALLEQHIVNLGRRTALARVAHLLLELDARLRLIGLGDEAGYRCPLTQGMIGDALGLTNVHVSRMIRELREEGCVAFTGGYVAFGNRNRLREIAEFDPAYLKHFHVTTEEGARAEELGRLLRIAP
jgi:PAS domain S-box-containing protein